jgi:hypothetical protein
MWETNFYTAGTDQGLTSTSFGNVGIAMGFEWGRSRTARRLRNKVDVVLGGSCWWSGPTWPVMRQWMARDHQYNVLSCGEAPTRMARMVGAPVAVAQHVGRVDSDTPLLPGVGWSTMMCGDSQIVDASGTILARLGPEDYNAIACAEVEIGPKEPILPIPVGFWAQPLAGTVQGIWHYQKLHGRISYKARHALGGFPWQHNPPTDLPNYNRADAAAELPLDDRPAVPVGEEMTANTADKEANLT